LVPCCVNDKTHNVARNSISAKEDNCEPACSVAIVQFNITFQNFKKCMWSTHTAYPGHHQGASSKQASKQSIDEFHVTRLATRDSHMHLHTHTVDKPSTGSWHVVFTLLWLVTASGGDGTTGRLRTGGSGGDSCGTRMLCATCCLQLRAQPYHVYSHLQRNLPAQKRADARCGSLPQPCPSNPPSLWKCQP